MKITAPLLIWLTLLVGLAARAEGTDGSVAVKTRALEQRAVAIQCSGYGTVTSPPAETLRIALPRPGQILSVAVLPGQSVTPGQALFTLRTEPTAKAGANQAAAALALAEDDARRTEQQFHQQLATASQVAAAWRALNDARAAWAAQQALGNDRPEEVFRAPTAGVVTALAVTPGERVTADKVALELHPRQPTTVTLAIRPEDAEHVKVGQGASITPIFISGGALSGRVSAIADEVSPGTHRREVSVRLNSPPPPGWVDGTRVHGTLTLGHQQSWVIPREAVLNDERGSYLYQVRQGQAHRVAVEAQEIGPLELVKGAFDPALPVVVEGNYELADGQAVREGGR